MAKEDKRPEEWNPTSEKGLQRGEFHPATNGALEYLKSLDYMTMERIKNTLETGVEQHDRLSEICSDTLKKLEMGDAERYPVSEIEVLGLAFSILNV